MKFAVWAEPPTKGIFGDLKPRFQIWNTGEVVIYLSEKEAQEFADLCNQEAIREKTGWKYSVKIL